MHGSPKVKEFPRHVPRGTSHGPNYFSSVFPFIFLYYPYNYEVDILQILEKFEKKKFIITLPKIKKNSQMSFYQWSTNDPLAINKFGIPEPISKMVKYPDVLIVPLVAFDKNLNRIGYGGGFYDRYIRKIRKQKKVLTIGFAYSFQKVKKIPTNNYDIGLDFIITNE